MLNNTKDTTKPMSLLSLILSFLALFVISGLLFAPIDKESKQVLIGLDFIICSVFLFQLTIDLLRSQNKKEYLKVHWIDFLASIPMIEPLRFARIFQILRVILVLRSGKRVFRELFRNRKETTLASIISAAGYSPDHRSWNNTSVRAQRSQCQHYHWPRCFVVGFRYHQYRRVRRSLPRDELREISRLSGDHLRCGCFWYDFRLDYFSDHLPNSP